MANRNGLVCVAGLALLTLGCSRSDRVAVPAAEATQSVAADDVWFVDQADESGLNFFHHSGHDSRYLFPEIMGGGVALFDMDGDQDLDVYFVQSGTLGEPDEAVTNQLFRNEGHGKFTDVTASSGAADSGYGMGVAAGDVDNDGDLDLYVTNVGPNRLWQNDGHGHFTDVTSAAGVGNDGWSTSAAFVDVDQDGDLDLYVCNYVFWALSADLVCNNRAGQPDYCSPNSYNAPQPDVLYINQGDGTFSDGSVAGGLRSSFGNGLGVVCGDFDDDGDSDVFVANDQMNNQYWINQGNGKFADQAMILGCAVDKNGKAKAGMGTCAADIDGDDDLDLLVVNLQAQADSFFRNEGAFFVDDTPMVGLGTSTRPFTRFGVGWADFNHDGHLDLFQANGRVTLPDAMPKGQTDPFGEPNILLIGNGSRFDLAPPGTIPSTSRTSRAAGFGDLDNDGDIDIVVVNRDAPAEILINRKGQENGNWLVLRVINDVGRDEVGAQVRCEVDGHQVRQDVNPHYSYLSSNDHRVHLGLGGIQTVDAIEVTWVDGTKERFGAQAANQFIELRQGTGQFVGD